MDWLSGHPMRRRLLFFAALVGAFLVLFTLISGGGGGVDEDSPAARAADWVVRQYEIPDSDIRQFGAGILIDALVSLAATGTEPEAAATMLEDLRPQASEYAGTGDTLNVGAAGKLIHVLGIYDEDVQEFVGYDLVAETRATMQTSGADTGRFAEAMVFEQALAILGLAMTDDGAPTEAVAWLSQTRCPSGEFTFDGVCPGATDADTTGIAVLALIAAGDDAAAESSLDWLEELQLPDGSIPGFGTPNSNSTAAAGAAFVAAGRDDSAQAAADFLASMQFADDSADAGGLRWVDGDTAANTFATVQGIWGMGVSPLQELSAMAGIDNEVSRPQ